MIPVRMYLKQMGQVPLLTREQEVEISKRIEDAENEVKRIIYSFGFAGKEHIALAEKLISEPPKERFDRVIVDKKIESRDTPSASDLRKLDQERSRSWTSRWTRNMPNGSKRQRKPPASKLVHGLSKSSTRSCRRPSRNSYYKQKVIEEMALVADNIHDKIQASLRAIAGTGSASANRTAASRIIESEQRKIKALEEFVRMPHAGLPQGVRAAEAFRRQSASRPRPKWSKPTCASSFPSPRNTPTAASPSST